ncbi:MAG: tetratricopeptide repeat protein [Perlucidibaca sp.]
MAYNEDETLDQLKTWWQRYGTPALLAAAAVLFAFAGWNWWSGKRMADATTAQALQQQMISAMQRVSGNPDDKAANTDLQRIGHQIIDEYDGTPYAIDAAMLLARRAVETGDLPEAVKQLQWALDQSSGATELLAKTRLARVLAAQKKTDEALALLKDIDEPGLAPVVDEIRGDILLGKGDRAAAADAYRSADAALAARDEARPLLAMKLADVGLEPAQRKSGNGEASAQ